MVLLGNMRTSETVATSRAKTDVPGVVLVKGSRAVAGSQSATLPNTRMQRTRSSPSALRSPLMRWPLGGREVLAVLLVALAGCVSVNGRLLGAWEPGLAQVKYSRDESLHGTTLLKVVVRDSNGWAYQGSEVSVSRSGGPGSLHFLLYLNAEGAVEMAMPVGEWTVEVAYPSAKPLRKQVNLIPGQRCTVEMFLITPDPEVVVS